MVIGGDDINSDIITLGTCFSMFVYIRAGFRFAMIGGNLTALLPFPALPWERPRELARELHTART